MSHRRLISLLIAAAVLWFVARDESWAVYLVMLAPFADLWPAADPIERRRRLRGDLLKLGVGFGAAIAMHLAMRDMLGGVIRPAEVVFSGWVYTGAMFLLDDLDRLLRRALRRVKPIGAAHAIRLAMIVAIAMPAAAAMIQVVRCKVGYVIPREAAAMNPAVFETRSADGVAIRGLYFDRGADTTLVVAHGLGAHSENFVAYLTRQLDGRAVNGLIFDFRAHGYSGGHTSTFGPGETRDLRAAIDWLTTNHPKRARRLILYAFSMGTAPAVAVAGDDRRVAGLIIDSGYAKLTDVARAMGAKLPAGGWVYRAAVPMACALSGANLYAVEPDAGIDSIDAPIMVWHGGADAVIPVEQGERLMGHRGVLIATVVAGGEHVNLAAHDPRYFERVGRFIDLILGGGPDGQPGATNDGGPSIAAPPPARP